MNDRPPSRKRKVSRSKSPQVSLSRSSGSLDSGSEEESETDSRKVARLSHTNGVSSSELAETQEKCPICLKLLTDQISAITDTCSYHTFCLTCLEEWSKIKKLCPVDRKEYSSILVLDSKGHVSSELPIKSTVSNVLHADAELILCMACGLFIDSEFTLICDSCDAIFHSDCVTLSPENYADQWLCDDCWCYFNEF
ncbi:unnamed protein product [Ceutorhynchus assimilis]|uniref:PHD and RING finger domain-containing protein 1 n=1 Tax=Ceutorhynchus assimilis TaxID=467358 RepID=A0A9N9MS13_9CUCU|nr:unnamed protein product [Ceutorhynchus assimilis]